MIRALILLSALISAGQARDTGVTGTEVLENDTVAVTRMHVPPGASGSIVPQTSSFVVVQVIAGDVEITQPGENSRAFRPAGATTYVPPNVGQRIANVGTTPFDVLVIKVKPSRPPAPSAPATDAPPGISRTTVLDNTDVRIVRVRFSPESREPVHTHPNDLLTMQISRARVDIAIGDGKAGDTRSEREPGFVQFVPRNTPHAYASADSHAFEILSVAIK